MDEIPQIKLESSLNLSKISPKTGGDDEMSEQTMPHDGPRPKKEENAGGLMKNEIKQDKIAGMKRKLFKFKFKMTKKKKRVLLGGIGVFGILVLFLAVAVLMPALKVYKKGMALKDKAFEVKASVDTQDISIIESKLLEFETELKDFDSAYNKLKIVSYFPYFGGFWEDGRAGLNAAEHGINTAKIMITTIKPYADIIGFSGGGGAASGEESANDRIEFIVQTVTEIAPKMDQIITEANLAKTEIDKINTARYPEKFKGYEVRSNLEKAVEMADEGLTMLTNSKPLMEAAPYLLGMDSTRTYMVIFQNDKELRPTGGFITAYSIMDVRNGKLQPVASSDIYSLDDNYSPVIDAPEAYREYIKGIYEINNKFRLRDMNWNPDFENSMEMFLEEASKAGISDIDGIIAVDTHVVVYLLDAIGQIGVPGFGNFSTEIVPECDCPQVIYELESFADNEGPVVWSENEPGKIVFAPANYDNRKKIIGPLMNSLISNALGQEKDKMPDLFDAAWKSITQKHVMLYLLDENSQKAVKDFNMAGKMQDYEGDYLHINNANLGGRKSNLYATHEVVADVEIARNGSVTNTLTITYKNPKEQDGWLNSVLPNWTRIYVPQGSELIEVEGFEVRQDPYEENGKTVFSGGFELRPLGVKQIVVKYKLPNTFSKNYNLLIQKQPGLDGPLYTVNIGKKSEEFFLKSDKELKFGI